MLRKISDNLLYAHRTTGLVEVRERGFVTIDIGPAIDKLADGEREALFAMAERRGTTVGGIAEEAIRAKVEKETGPNRPASPCSKLEFRSRIPRDLFRKGVTA